MAGKNTAVFGIYTTRRSVENAVDSLKIDGFRNTDISVLLPENEGTKDFAHEKQTKAPEGAVAGAGTVSAACTTAPVTLTVGGLWPNNTYNYTVSITNPVGSDSANGTQASNQMRFTVVCPNNSGGYCNSGIWAYLTPSQQGTADSPAMPVGATGIPECHIAGNRVINATPWGGKSTDQWVRFQHSGTAYFPWAWSVLDGGDNLNMIPQC